MILQNDSVDKNIPIAQKQVKGIISEEEILEYLSESLAEALFINREELDPDKVFTEIGMDSIIAVEWIKAINKKYGTSIAATKIYEHPNVQAFAGFMIKELNENTTIPISMKQDDISLNSVPDVEIIHAKPGVPLEPVDKLLQETGPVVQKGREDIHVSLGERLFRENVSEESILEYLSESLAEALFINREELDPDKVFTEIGMDSIIAVEWIKAINKKYGTLIAATKIYEHPNVRAFADFMIKELNENTTIPISMKQDDVSLNPVPEVEIIPAKSEVPSMPLNNLIREAGPIVKKDREEMHVSKAGKTFPGNVSEESILEYLSESLAEALFINREELDPDKIFTEIGMDSIIAVEWIKAINKKYGTSIAATKIYEHPNVRAFAGFMIKELNENTAIPIPTEQGDISFNPVPGVESIPTKPEVMSMPLNNPDVRELAGFISKEANSNIPAFEVKPFKEIPTEEKSLKPEVEALPEFIKEQPSFDISSGLTRKLTSSIHSKNRFINKSNRVELNIKPVNDENETIAIIGMSGRYPGANNLDDYWNNLSSGTNSIKEIPGSRWDINQYYDPRQSMARNGKMYCKWLGALNDVEYFDPLFFNISPVEAESMDPQHRLFLQEGYKAFEDAGYSPKLLSGKKCAVYLGIMNNEYNMLQFKSNPMGGNVTGSNNSIGAARLSYFLNLKGPAIPIDTACSSTLVATHIASKALLDHEIDMALIGGVTLFLVPESYIGMCMAGMLTPGGQCRSFDNSADGIVPGEAVGTLVLKRLKDAERDHDQIYGKIIASGINHDGKTNGITAPSMESQVDLIRGVYNRYNIHPESIGYVEMHGTGTKIGDPIELEALAAVYRERTQQKKYCPIGSVKSNIGHTSAAAGAASIQKVLLCMKNKQLVPSLHFNKPNELFDFERSPFYVNTKTKAWEKISQMPRRAGVSSFGVSGTNCHIVLEEYIPQDLSNRKKNLVNLNEKVLFTLSAKTEAQLKIYAGIMKNWLESHVNIDLNDLCFTLQIGRDEMDYRLAFLADSRESITGALASFISGKLSSGIFAGDVRKNRDTIHIFNTDEDAKSLLENWMRKRKLQKLAEVWVKGFKINWEKLYTDNLPFRISLPSYPFARERYWITIAENKVNAEQKPASTPKLQSKEKVILSKDWIQSDIKINDSAVAGSVVVLATKSIIELAVQLYKNYEQINVYPVIHGGSQKEGAISSDFYSRSAGEELFQEIRNKIAGKTLLGLIDITALDAYYDDSLEIEAGKIVLIQGLIENFRDENFKILQITHKLHSFQERNTTMQGARLAGLYRMLSAEYKQITSVTLDSNCEIYEEENLIHQIQNEFLNRSGEKISECCCRDNIRYEPRLVVTHDRNTIKELQIPIPYKQDEVILITGGSRGIGAAVAEHIVAQGAKNLVIIGREALPDSREWKQILENENKGKPGQGEKIKRLQSYIDSGVKVRYYNTPLTAEDTLKSMVNEIHNTLGRITGVFHCAGLVGTNPAFFKKSIDDIESVCAPKIQGTAALHNALINEPLSFFILFSSISSIAPTLSVGHSDYAMANSYMNYYAANQAGEGKNYIKSIIWPAWGETGFAAGTMSASYENTGLLSLTTKEGLYFLDIARKIDSPTIIPCSIIAGEFRKDDLLKSEITANNKKTAKTAALVQPAFVSKVVPVKASGADLNLSISRWLREIFMAELKISNDRLDEEKPFDEYGVDSILLAQLAQTLQKQVKTPISPALLLENRTLKDLSRYFIEHHSDNFRSETADETESPIEYTGEIFGDSEAVQIQMDYPVAMADKNEDIAVVGISCRFPGAPNKDAFWELLCKGESAIKPVPGNRWKSNGSRVDYGGWVDGIDLFDPDFFKIKDSDAAIMDPQARLILEESLNAVYNAGYHYKDLSGEKIGVYIGGRSQTVADIAAIFQANNPILGVGQNYLAANISRFFNFTGPSLVVDTACSSGLVSMSMAADSLKDRRIKMAIVGSVSLLLNSFGHEMFASRNILSKNGEFYIFDKRSSGEVLGEGCAAVVLKRLSDAIGDGDTIYGIIKSIAVNNDGRTLGPGSPNINAWKEVMQDGLRLSGNKIEDIGYIEVNGGGSPAIDTIEIKALAEIYRLNNRDINRCAIGSVKPNIGHLLLTSGMAGFIRCILSVTNKKIPPFLSAKEPFEYYDFSKSRVLFNREAVDWQVEPGKKRIAAQNSFPDGGTNCHVVVEEFSANDEYRQIHFPASAPGMNKKHFPVNQPDLPQMESLPVTKDGRNLKDFLQNFKKDGLVKDKKTFTNIQNTMGI